MAPWKSALLLALEFFKTGLFSVGGGLATLPFLTEIGEKYGWYTASQLADMVAISESTPGPIGVNMATYAGYSVLGVPGAFISTLSLIAPSVIIIILIAKFLSNFSENRWVRSAFYGLRPAVAALIASALWSLARITLLVPGQSGAALFNWKAILIFALISVLLQIPKCKKIHPAFWLLAAAAGGVVLQI